MAKPMSASRHFSADYFDARARFADAAAQADARREQYECPAKGPGGEALTTDVAWVGPEAAENVLVTISATHGVEGFCGSGVQIGSFAEGFAKELPARTALLQIHAINPYGFAWLRRVTEENVDLNRNFLDHGAPYPVNPGFEALFEVLCPRDWNDAVIAETGRTLDAYAATEGARALQTAISAGQYSHADGIFFGGNGITWSRRMLTDVLRKRAGRARRVAIVDYHTGLGPRGHGERICPHEPKSAALTRATEWYQGDLTVPALGTSSSVELHGCNVIGFDAALPDAEVTMIALEYGTLPSPEVRLSLRADNWLHAHGAADSTKGKAIKAQIREAFYQDQDDWKQQIFDRGIETQRLALAGMSQG